MILWLTAQATPQFTPVLNALSRDAGLPIFAYYLLGESGSHGWGTMPVEHPHAYHEALGTLRDFRAGLRMAARPDLQAAVVFGYSKPVAMGLLLGCRIRRVPVFTQSDTDYGQQRNKPLMRRLLKRILLRVLYPRKTRVWTISESNARYWSSHGLKNQHRIPFESPVPVADMLEAPDQQSEGDHIPPIVLYVGRLAPEKRLEDAILAVQLLREQGLDVQLRLVGNGTLPRVPGLQDHHPDWVHLAGGISHDELAPHYLEARVLVLPSEAEAYGLVVREALQFGLPVVASRVVPAARELCDLGWNLVPPRDPPALAAALKQSIDLATRWPPRPPIDTSVLYREELRSVGQERR